MDCKPGFLKEGFSYLKDSVKEQPWLSECALIMDAIAICKQIVWDHNEGKFVGTANYGGIASGDSEELASEALFLLMVSYSSSFKCPVAYFLINKCDTNVQSQLITSCLRSLYEVGVNVRSITCDGTVTNISTFNNLGCNFSPII